MFTIIKIIQPFFSPSTLFLIGFLMVFFLIRKRIRFGTILLGIFIVIYYVFSIEPTVYLLERSLTRNVQHVAVEEMRDAATVAIVVLAGGAHTEEGRAFPELGGASWKRFWHGIELYRVLEGKVPLLYVGGSGDPFSPVSKEAELAQQYAVSIGIPEERFWIESQSRDTYENGMAVKRILNERFPDMPSPRVVLVTSATHMPRALGVFEKQGIATFPAPADLGQISFSIDPLSFLPSAAAFSDFVTSIHEWLGIFEYKLRNRI